MLRAPVKLRVLQKFLNMKIRHYSLCLQFWAVVVLYSLLEISQCFASETNLMLLKQTPDGDLEIVLSIRASLDKELQNDPNQLSPQERSAAKERIAKISKELFVTTGTILGKFPTNNLLLQASQQQVYGGVLFGMLHKDAAALLGNMAEYIPSCLFESETSKQLSISLNQASQLQAAAESSFADAVITALKFEPENYNGVFDFVERARADTGKKLAQAILDGQTSDDSLKYCAPFILNRRFNIGQPVTLQFTAMDGRQVNLSELRGKVVLVDFWATDCVPCMSQLPELKFLYQQYRDQGFEIVAVSSDNEQKRVARVVQEKAIPWPVYVSEKGRSNEFTVAFGVSAIPNYWLIDRKGIAREIMADSNLEKKIKFLLVE